MAGADQGASLTWGERRSNSDAFDFRLFVYNDTEFAFMLPQARALEFMLAQTRAGTTGSALHGDPQCGGQRLAASEQPVQPQVALEQVAPENGLPPRLVPSGARFRDLVGCAGLTAAVTVTRHLPNELMKRQILERTGWPRVDLAVPAGRSVFRNRVTKSKGYDMKRSASAHWTGDLKTGKGKISTESGVLKDNPYTNGPGL